MRRGTRVVIAVAALCAWPAAAVAQSPLAPLSDLAVLEPITGPAPARVPTQRPPEPPEVATPRADCVSGVHREPDIQGRVPAGAAKDGLDCNVTLLAHQGDSGGFRVWRFVDGAGHECAYYDTTLVFPLNAFRLDAQSVGVAVVDMTDPAKPVQTATLTQPAMLSPHESLNLNVERGLLVAEMGSGLTVPAPQVAVYSVKDDCRHPKLMATSTAVAGHESGFSPDGRTFYAAGTASPTITAFDLSDPAKPRVVARFASRSHGLGVSDDGNRAYLADAVSGDLIVLDTSEIQSRKVDPKVREISRLTWRSASIPQNAMPFSVHGHPYLLETDEFSGGTLGGDFNRIGAARIIDIADETKPRVVSNLRLEVNQRAQHAELLGDPGALSPIQGYTAHYCNVYPRVDPVVAACSFILSGLRVFDITDVTHPKEIAYYVAKPAPRAENGFSESNFAMSMPQIIPERREVWYTDATTGFYALRVDPRVWPATRPASGSSTATKTTPRRCPGARRSTATVRLPRGARVRQVRATLGGRRVRAVRRGGRVTVRVDLRRSRATRVRLVVRVRLKGGRTITATRTYRPCRTA